MQKLPEPFKILVDQFAQLPGLGAKSALRCALALLKWPENRTKQFGLDIHDLRDKLHICNKCSSLSTSNPCELCSDPERQKNVLCLIPDWDSLLIVEEGCFYKGQYFILGGLLSPLDNIQSEHLEFLKLKERLAQNEINEIVLALGTTLEADNTSEYIRNIVNKEFSAIKIFRLAQGIPLGAEVKYMDKETLKQSLKYKQEL